MKFLQYDLDARKSGEIVEVTLTSSANVHLMDTLGHLVNGLGQITAMRFITALPLSKYCYLGIEPWHGETLLQHSNCPATQYGLIQALCIHQSKGVIKT